MKFKRDLAGTGRGLERLNHELLHAVGQISSTELEAVVMAGTGDREEEFRELRQFVQTSSLSEGDHGIVITVKDQFGTIDLSDTRGGIPFVAKKVEEKARPPGKS